MINWGIIGAGDVAEVKSGPAFNKVAGSKLLAVMRRNEEKVKDFATRHKVPLWYTSVDELLANKDINAVYIATPPASHKEYALKAIAAGKDIYLEKPMALNLIECQEIIAAAKNSSSKICIAHYRRNLAAFKTVKDIIDSGKLGQINFARISILQPADSDIIAETDENWRMDPTLSGGGLFHDIAPHQIDLMLQYFGTPNFYSGTSAKQKSSVDDLVTGTIRFENEVIFQGIWSFCSPSHVAEENCTIIGEHGHISFSFYGEKVFTEINGTEEILHFDFPENIQLPMIEEVCKYFMEEGPNPCSAEEAAKVIEIMDSFVS